MLPHSPETASINTTFAFQMHRCLKDNVKCVILYVQSNSKNNFETKGKLCFYVKQPIH